MTIGRIALALFTLTLFADSLFALRDCVYWDRWCRAENDAEIAQHNHEAMDRLVASRTRRPRAAPSSRSLRRHRRLLLQPRHSNGNKKLRTVNSKHGSE